MGERGEGKRSKKYRWTPAAPSVDQESGKVRGSRVIPPSPTMMGKDRAKLMEASKIGILVLHANIRLQGPIPADKEGMKKR